MKKLMMALVLMPVLASADQETVDGIIWNYSISGGQAEVGTGSWTPAISEATAGAVRIPSTLGGCSVTSVGKAAFWNCRALTSVTIPEGVTNIGEYAFYACSALASVTIPSSVTRIGNGAFEDCVALASVTIPSNMTSIGGYAFYNCRGLVSVTIPPGVTNVGSAAFADCVKLETVILPRSLRTIEGNNGRDVGTFRNCVRLREITIGSDIEEIGMLAFETCNSIEKVHVIGGKVGHVRQLFRDGGVDVRNIVFDSVEEPVPGVSCTIAFDAQGGTPEPATIVRGKGKTYGTLPVVSKRGCRFVGWYTDEGEKVLRSSVVLSDITLYARWVAADSSADAFVGRRVQIATGLVGYAAKGLPKGLKFNKSTGEITGMPTGEAGDMVVTFTKKGKTPVDFLIIVAAISDNAVGTFNGFVSDAAGNRGTLQVTATKVGKLTAKVVTAAGSVSFSGTGWDDVSDAGVYSATLTTKKGDVLALALDSAAAWDANQLGGRYSPAGGRGLDVTAQRNAFGKTWHFNAAGDEGSGWTLSFAPDARSAALTVTLKADGSTSLAGKLPNGTNAKGKDVFIKVSASGYANVGCLRGGAILADFAPIGKVGGVKKVLSITANLWLDRSDSHAEGVGTAECLGD